MTGRAQERGGVSRAHSRGEIGFFLERLHAGLFFFSGYLILSDLFFFCGIGLFQFTIPFFLKLIFFLLVGLDVVVFLQCDRHKVAHFHVPKTRARTYTHTQIPRN